MGITSNQPRARQRRTRFAAALAAAGALIMSSGVMVMATATTASATGGDDEDREPHKSYVCKYVGKPGVSERLQGGGNPIWVANSSIAGNTQGNQPVAVGDEFSDGQERSVVIVANTEKLTPEPGVDQCPAPSGPTAVAPAVTQASACEVEGSYTIPTTEGVQYLLDNQPIAAGTYPGPASGTITAVATAEGVALTNPGFSYALNVDPAAECPDFDQEIPVPAKPATQDPCGPGNISFVLPPDVDPSKVAWTVNRDGSITFTPKRGYVFSSETNPTSLTYQLPADSDEPCPTTPPATPKDVTPVVPSVNPPTCEAAGSLNVPTQPTGLVAQQSGTVPGQVTFTYTAQAGYALAAGSPTSTTLTVQPQLSGEQCEDEVAPAEVAGTESSAPKPSKKPAVKPAVKPAKAQAPQVLGTQAAVPTAVDAGLGGLTAAAPAQGSLLGQLLVTGGLALMLAAGWLMTGRRQVGAREA